ASTTAPSAAAADTTRWGRGGALAAARSGVGDPADISGDGGEPTICGDVGLVEDDGIKHDGDVAQAGDAINLGESLGAGERMARLLGQDVEHDSAPDLVARIEEVGEHGRSRNAV